MFQSVSFFLASYHTWIKYIFFSISVNIFHSSNQRLKTVTTTATIITHGDKTLRLNRGPHWCSVIHRVVEHRAPKKIKRFKLRMHFDKTTRLSYSGIRIQQIFSDFVWFIVYLLTKVSNRDRRWKPANVNLKSKMFHHKSVLWFV